MTKASFSQLCQARQVLGEFQEYPPSIEEVARQARLSSFQFIRKFDALFGVTPHQFRIQSRLDRAKVLLAKGEMNVTEVCFEVGMSSLGSFSDLFTRRIGSSPSEYQRRARTLVQIPGVLPHALFPGCFSLMGLLPKSAFCNFREALPAIARVESPHAD